MNIIWKRPDGSVAVTVLTGDKNKFDKMPKKQQQSMLKRESDKLKKRGDIPAGWEVVATNIDLPEDRMFRDAWSWSTSGPAIDIDMVKAKEVLHVKRRARREEEFAPLDKQIMIVIGDQGKVDSIEADRVKVRVKYDKIQNDIDGCSDETSLRSLIV